MNVNQLIARVVWAFIGIGVVVVIALSVGCATVATLESPTGKIWTYTGPKKVEYFWKKGDEEIHYSGLSTPWWAPFVSVLSGAASSALQNPAESQTNINLKP